MNEQHGRRRPLRPPLAFLRRFVGVRACAAARSPDKAVLAPGFSPRMRMDGARSLEW